MAAKKKNKVMKPQHKGASFWNPDNGETIVLEGKNIKWFEKEFSNREGYKHFFEEE